MGIMVAEDRYLFGMYLTPARNTQLETIIGFTRTTHHFDNHHICIVMRTSQKPKLNEAYLPI